MEWSDGGRGEVNTVHTTGIYCRAGCAGRPNPSNTARMSAPAAAEAAGFRPCLRCRPDRLPVVPIRAATDPVVADALVRISDGALDHQDEAALGRTVGVSARHLRRLFVDTVGATPTQVARSRRAHFARLLLDETDVPITEIAFASGFGSVRSMNDVVAGTFRRSPTELRRARRSSPEPALDGGLRLRLRSARAADFGAMLRCLADDLIPGVEAIEDGVYRRSTIVCGHPGVIEVSSCSDDVVDVAAHLPTVSGLIDAVSSVRRVFRLDHTESGPPSSWSEPEAVVRAAASRADPVDPSGLLGVVADRWGVVVPTAVTDPVMRVLPSPELLRAAASDDNGHSAGPDSALTALVAELDAA